MHPRPSTELTDENRRDKTFWFDHNTYEHQVGPYKVINSPLSNTPTMSYPRQYRRFDVYSVSGVLLGSLMSFPSEADCLQLVRGGVATVKNYRTGQYKFNDTFGKGSKTPSV